MSASERKERKIAPRPQPSSSFSRAGEDDSHRRTHSSAVPFSNHSPSQEPDARSHRSRTGGAPSASGHTNSFPYVELPSSVRNAPPEMRKPIRRKQNNSSSKRLREQQQTKNDEMKAKEHQNTIYIKQLEAQVSELEEALQAKRKTRKNKVKARSTANTPGEFFQKEKYFGDPF